MQPLESRLIEYTRQIADVYHATLLNNRTARNSLSALGVSDAAILSGFRIGYADGTFGKMISGAAFDQLLELGFIKKDGTERFLGCITFPLFDLQKNPVGMYGRRITGGPEQDIFLPGPRVGLINHQAAGDCRKIILTSSVLDAMALIGAGIRNVIPCFGRFGMIDEHLDLFKRSGVTDLYLIHLDSSVGLKLESLRFRVSSIELPGKMDVVMFLQRFKNTRERLMAQMTDLPDKNSRLVEPAALQMKQLLDLKTISQMKSISIFTLRKYAKNGMPHYKIGKKILVSPDEFEAWFDREYRVVETCEYHKFNQVVDDTLADLNRVP